MVVPKSTATFLCILVLYATRNDLQTHTLLSPGNSRPTTSATTPPWCLRSRQSLARSAIPPEAIGVQMAGGQMCAAFELTFSVRHEGLFKVWIVKLCWLGRVQQNVSKYKMIFLLSFSFLCRLDTGTLLLMLVTRQSLSSVGTGRKELFALNTALSAGARGTEWRCLTFMDNFDRLHGWWFVMDGHWVMPCALRSGYPIAWADQVQVFQLQVLYHFVVFSEVQ